MLEGVLLTKLARMLKIALAKMLDQQSEIPRVNGCIQFLFYTPSSIHVQSPIILFPLHSLCLQENST